MLGKILEGAAWFATLSLATAGGLTFLPDGAWETFPTALRPARAKLAEFGVAPALYRADFDAEKNGVLASEQGSKPSEAKGKDGVWSEDAWQASTTVRIGERWKRVREVGETAFVDRLERSGASGLAAETRTQDLRLDASALALPGAPSVDETLKTLDAAEGWGTSDAALGGGASDDGVGEDGAIPPFDAGFAGVETGVPNAETAAPLVGVEDGNAFGVGVEPGSEENEGNAEAAGGANVASNVGEANEGIFNGDAGFNAPSTLLEEADAALTNDWGATTVAAPNAPIDEVAELRDALAAASVASTPKEIKTVFETLSRIRGERGRRLAAEDSQALDAALDRLAFEVFYNPAQAILEPRWQTAPGESLALIAERLGVTPETLAEINGIKGPVDAPLPVGTTLKTVRGPASAEISIAKKELTLRFNGLYAGRFALGVPEKSATLRGDFRVVEKLANPNCDAVDANGQTIAIPGGAPENPLGVAWIALDGGVGLQGTNRPELVGQTIPENGGFVFSNREISQLSVLLPVGAVVAIVD